MIAITRALSSALLHFVWQGLAISMLFWLALFLLRRRSAQLRYVAACAALAMLVVMPVVTTIALYEQPTAVRGFTFAARSTPAPAATAPSAVKLDWLALAQTWAVPVWACGVLMFSLRMAWGCAQLAAMRRAGEAADFQLGAAFADLARRMGVRRPVRLLLSTATDSPSVTGWLRPIVLLPISAIAGLTPDQLEAVLAHELAHVCRHDYLVNLLQMAAETLLFYHPAVWWISARIRHERELCCDDLAVRAASGAIVYARALAALEKMRASRPALALGSTDGPLFFRIRRLVLGNAEYGPSRLSGAVAFSLALAGLALCVNWARGQEPVRGWAVQEGPHEAVSVSGAALLHRPRIEYPESLIEKRVTGTVSVEANLDAAGNVIDARVLTGPDELRRTALASVLNWHFDRSRSGSRPVVQISFQPPAMEAVALKPELAVAVPDGAESTVIGSVVRADTENQVAKVLSDEVSVQQERLAELEREPAANAEKIAKARLELYQGERRLEISRSVGAGEPGDGPFVFRIINQFENTRKFSGRKLAIIEVRGLSEERARELLARLPLHEGDTLTDESMKAAQGTIRQFDEHLEGNFGREPEGAMLRIQPPGAGDEPVVRGRK
jgi:TonB family protein